MAIRRNLVRKKKPVKKAVPHGVPVVHNNVQLRSGLEKTCYEALKKAGITFNYEQDTFTLQDKFNSNGEFYLLFKRKMTYQECVKEGIKARFKDKSKPKDVYRFGLVKNSIKAITITPDFSNLDKESKTGWIIETKGDYTNEYKLKLRLFRYYLMVNGWNIDYFAPNNKTNINKCISIIKQKYYDE